MELILTSWLERMQLVISSMDASANLCEIDLVL
jgi:hypothetical protein